MIRPECFHRNSALRCGKPVPNRESLLSDVEKASRTPKAWLSLESLNLRLASGHATCGQRCARQNSTCIASSSDLSIADSPRSGRNSLAQRAALGESDQQSEPVGRQLLNL